jgi:hypothetical protein
MEYVQENEGDVISFIQQQWGLSEDSDGKTSLGHDPVKIQADQCLGNSQSLAQALLKVPNQTHFSDAGSYAQPSSTRYDPKSGALEVIGYEKGEPMMKRNWKRDHV